MLLGRIFCGHVEMRFWFAIVPIDNFLDLINFLIMKIRECFLDLQDIHCNIGQVWFGQRRNLYIRFPLGLFYNFLKYFDILFTSLDNFARIGGEREDTKMSLIISFPLLFTRVLITCGLNFNLTLFLKDVLELLTNKLINQILGHRCFLYPWLNRFLETIHWMTRLENLVAYYLKLVRHDLIIILA